jgi:hypothetical protein
MYVLNDEQVTYILNDIRRSGIESEELQLDLLDHICCVIETEMLPNKNFEEFYRSILPRFFKRELREIQEETTLLLTFKNYYAMKKVMLNGGMFSAVSFIIGAFLKAMHLPGASVFILLGIASFCFLFLPLLSILRVKEQKETKDKVVIGIATVFGILISLATLFKVMHWPYANNMWMVSLGILFFLFLPIYFFTGIRNAETKINTIISSILILTAGGLLFTLTNLRASRWTEESVYNSDDHLRNAAMYASAQNQLVYAKDTLGSDIKLLQQKSNMLCAKIELLKVGLMNHSDHGEEGLSEAQLIRNYGSSLNFAHDFLFDNMGKAKKDLAQIKSDLADFNEFVESTFKHNPSALLSLEDVYKFGEKDQAKITWEENNFGNISIATTLRNFNQLILNIRIVEAGLLN